MPDQINTQIPEVPVAAPQEPAKPRINPWVQLGVQLGFGGLWIAHSNGVIPDSPAGNTAVQVAAFAQTILAGYGIFSTPPQVRRKG
jgi:uncharacterized membrane protein